MRSHRKTNVHQRAVEGKAHGRIGDAQEPPRPAPASRVLDFVQAVRSRYGERHWHWARSGFVYRHQRPAFMLRSIHHHTLLHWTPQLALSISPPVPLRLRQVETLSNPYHAPRQTDEISGFPRNPFLNLPPTYVEEERITLRRPGVTTSPVLRRTPARLNLHPSTLEAPGRIEPDIPPIPLVLHRQNQAVEVEGVAPVDSTVDGKHLGRKSPMDRADDRTTPIQPVDVRRLTDEVIHTIDRRIIAQRERLGRV